MRNVWISALCVALLSLLNPVWAQKTEQGVFAGDERLAQKVRIQAEGIPVGDLLRQLSVKTAVTLYAAADIREEKVVLFGPPRPLRETLDDLAALFNNHWIRTDLKDAKPFYTFTRTRQAREFAAALVEYKQRAMLKMLDQQIRALNEAPAQLARRKEDDPIRTHLSDRNGRGATAFFARLDPRQRQQLIERGHLPPSPLRSLPPVQQNALSELVLNDATAEYEEDNKAALTPVERAEKAHARAEARAEALTMLNTADVRFTYEGDGGDITLAVGSFSTSLGSFDVEPAPFQQGNPYTGKPNPKRISLPENLDIAGLGNIPHWIDRLRKLAEATGRPVLSDYHRCALAAEAAERLGQKLSDARRARRQAAAPEEEHFLPYVNGAGDAAPAEPPPPLNAFCGAEERYWWPRGDTLLFRYAKWYKADPFEPPDSWVLTMARQVRGRKGIPTYQEIASLLQLTPRQIAGLTYIYGPALSDGGDAQSFADDDLFATNNARDCLALLHAAVPNARQPLTRGNFPRLEYFQREAERRTREIGQEEDNPPMPDAPRKPGTIRATELPPSCWPRLQEFLYGLSSYSTSMDPKQMRLRLTYQCGAATPLDSPIFLLSSEQDMTDGEIQQVEREALRQEAPAENAPEEERKAYYAKFRALRELHWQRLRNRYEERLHGLLKPYARVEEMERSQDAGHRVVVLWLSAASENEEIDEAYTFCLPFALADDRRAHTQIEILP